MANQQKYFCEVVKKHNKEILRETISTEAEDMNKGRNSTEMTLQFLFTYVYVYEFVCACVSTYVRTYHDLFQLCQEHRKQLGQHLEVSVPGEDTLEW